MIAYEKGADHPSLRYIDYGAIALRRSVLAEHEPGKAFSLEHVQRQLASSGKLRAYEASERFYEIGSEAGIADLEAKLAGRSSG